MEDENDLNVESKPVSIVQKKSRNPKKVKHSRSVGVDSIAIPQIEPTPDSGSEGDISNVSITHYLKSNFPGGTGVVKSSTFRKKTEQTSLSLSPDPALPVLRKARTLEAE